MTLDLEDEYGLDLGFDYEKTATEVINQVLEEEGCPYEAQVNLLLTSDPEIHRRIWNTGKWTGLRMFYHFHRWNMSLRLIFPGQKNMRWIALTRIRENCSLEIL